MLYVLHGPQLDRTTNGKGPIADMMSDEIDKLDAESWFDPKFAGERPQRVQETIVAGSDNGYPIPGNIQLVFFGLQVIIPQERDV